jgi:hypothetical protein
VDRGSWRVTCSRARSYRRGSRNEAKSRLDNLRPYRASERRSLISPSDRLRALLEPDCSSHYLRIAGGQELRRFLVGALLRITNRPFPQGWRETWDTGDRLWLNFPARTGSAFW